MKITMTSKPGTITAADIEIGEHCIVGRQRLQRIALPGGMVQDSRLPFVNEGGVLQLIDQKDHALISPKTVPFSEIPKAGLFSTNNATVFARCGDPYGAVPLGATIKALSDTGQGLAMRQDDGSLHVFAMDEQVRLLDGELRVRPLAGVSQ